MSLRNFSEKELKKELERRKQANLKSFSDEEIVEELGTRRTPDSKGYCRCPEGPETYAGDWSQTCGRCGGNWY